MEHAVDEARVQDHLRQLRLHAVLQPQELDVGGLRGDGDEAVFLVRRAEEETDRRIVVRVLGEREIDRPAAVAVLRRRLAEPRRRATLQPARQEPSLDDAPGVVVGDAREIARPCTHVPDAVQARVAAAERAAHRLRRMDADVADLDRAQFDHRAGRLQLDAYVPLLPLHKRRDVDSRARDCVRLVAVHVRGEDGVVEERPEVVDAVAAREAARRREAVRVCRIGEP